MMIRLAGAFLLLVMLSGCSPESGIEVIDLGTVTGCDVARQSCRTTREGMSVDLTLGPGVTPLQPFDVQLQLTAGDVVPESVVVDFQMDGMDMGINRYRLRPEGELWTARATLPVCTASRMDWYAQVEFTRESTSYRLRFPFVVEAN